MKVHVFKVIEGKISSRSLKGFHPYTGISSIQLLGAIIKELVEMGYDEAIEEEIIVSNMCKLGEDNTPYIPIGKMVSKIRPFNIDDNKSLERYVSTIKEIYDKLNNGQLTIEVTQNNGENKEWIKTIVRKGRGKEKLFGTRQLWIKKEDNFGFLLYTKNEKIKDRISSILGDGLLDRLFFGGDKTEGNGIKAECGSTIDIPNDMTEYKVALGDFIPSTPHIEYIGRLHRYNSITGSIGYSFLYLKKDTLAKNVDGNIHGKILKTSDKKLFYGKTLLWPLPNFPESVEVKI